MDKKKEIRIMNEKRAEVTIGIIIFIVLGLVVLVVLVFGFTTGWSNLWDKIIGFGGGEVNVQSVVQSCQLACTTGSTYDYCTRNRSVVFEEGVDAEKLTCNKLKGRNVGLSCDIGCDDSGGDNAGDSETPENTALIDDGSVN